MTPIYRRHPAAETRSSQLRQFALRLSLLITTWSASIAVGALIMAHANPSPEVQAFLQVSLKWLAVSKLAYWALWLLHRPQLAE
jgi:hypothetical protein